jgi:hypothetical protein
VRVSLQSHPELFRGARGTGKPENSIRRDGTSAVDDYIDASRWNVHGSSEAILADAPRYDRMSVYISLAYRLRHLGMDEAEAPV